MGSFQSHATLKPHVQHTAVVDVFLADVTGRGSQIRAKAPLQTARSSQIGWNVSGLGPSAV